MRYATSYDPVQAGSIHGDTTTPHDAAVVRATRAHFSPPRFLSTQPLKTLFVANLDPDTSASTLRSYFSSFGTVDHVDVVCNNVTGVSRGYAFVTFERSRAAHDAYERAHKSVLDGRELLVDYERGRVMPGWIPRRLGGGYGGKKESGQLRFGARDRPFRPTSRHDYSFHGKDQHDDWHALQRRRMEKEHGDKRRRPKDHEDTKQKSPKESRHRSRSYRDDEKDERKRHRHQHYTSDRASYDRERHDSHYSHHSHRYR